MTTSQPFARRISSRGSLRAAALLLAACALAAFALRPLLAVDARVLDSEGLLAWFTQPTGLWLPFVLAGSGLLAWRRRDAWRRRPRSRTALATTSFGALAMGVALWCRLTGVDDVMVFAAALAGAALAARRGLRGVRTMAVPSWFLLFAISPPPRLVSEAYWWIQIGSARAATELVRATGTPVLGEGIALTTPSEVFGIIESCTALGILFVLSAGSVLAREVIRDAGPRSWLLVLSAPPVAMLLNLARITAIVLHPSLNRLHHLGQWAILLALGTLLLAAIGRALRPRQASPERPPRATPHAATTLAPRSASDATTFAPRSASDATTLAPTALVLAALLALTSVLPTPSPRAETPMPPVRSIPMQHGEWVAKRLPVDSLFLGYVVFREVVARRYERDDRIVDLFVGEASPRSDWSSPFSPKTLLPGLGWVPVNDPPQAGGIDLPLPPSQSAWVARDATRWWVVQWRFGDPGLLRESLQQLLALDASPFRARPPRRVIRLATPVDSLGPDGIAEAKAAIASFADAFADLLFPEGT